MSRGDIADAAVKRLLKEYTGEARISAKAAALAGESVEEFVMLVGQKCAKLLAAKKKETVQKSDVDHVVLELDCKAKKAPGLHREQRGLAEAGIERIFRSGLGKHRISEPAKKAIVQYAEGRLMCIGHAAKVIASAARRQTVQDKDIEGAITLSK
jgi:histone H3/H4